MSLIRCQEYQHSPVQADVDALSRAVCQSDIPGVTDLEKHPDPQGQETGWKKAWKSLPHPVRWIGVLIVGLTFMVAGIAMLVLPGPGIVFILLGLAVLASEFTWAAVIMERARTTGGNIWDAVKSRTGKSDGTRS